jgi:hypothetical protein
MLYFSTVQLLVHPSPFAKLPSSLSKVRDYKSGQVYQDSVMVMMELPQIPLQTDGSPTHSHPTSTVQLEEQPSPDPACKS